MSFVKQEVLPPPKSYFSLLINILSLDAVLIELNV